MFSIIKFIYSNSSKFYIKYLFCFYPFYTYTWESGKNYIYIFTLEEKSPKLVKVISEELKYFDCNDIIPGGSFSNEDMTE